MYKKKTMIYMSVVFFAIQTAIMLALVYKGRPDYARSVMAATGFLGIYTLLEVKLKLYMGNYVRLLVMLAVFFDAFYGYFYDLYVTSFTFDKLLHIFGTYAFALFAYSLIIQRMATPIAKPVKFLLAASLGLGIGAFYEIMEFITDTVSPPVSPSQPSLLDTDLDLAGDMIGALLAAIHATAQKFTDRED